ncbi:acetate kinase [Rhizobium sp. NFR07]|uniref:acetate/propionate family kinase n=1 Tax=Rhizobium sp. NFR07 TaxID=1566262 RepID=UPI0008E67901|nr:acetate/propionate family kinase [Rhizobium sp. NFR07]SFB09448.1 acetate kinase [Rhizobium sp. NFR07]
MTDSLLVTFNAGSSTVKIGIFGVEDGEPKRIGKAVVDFSAHPLTLEIKEGPQETDIPLRAKSADDLSELMDEVLTALTEHFPLDRMTAAGHRIVHGGDRFDGAAALTKETISEIDALTELAPLHQPQALRMIRAMRQLRPKLFQTASFDTTFHLTQDETVRRLAIPRDLHDRGVKRYGFHGLSYNYVAGALKKQLPGIAERKVVIAHLGSGASLCGIEGGRSRDCSMGFSTLDGIPMSTRPGWLDPGVILHLIGPLGKSITEVEDMLYHKSGLLGVSGISGDTRDLLEDESSAAREALDLLTLRISGEIGRIVSMLGGLDALVFTAGVGEHQPKIRAMIAERLRWLGAAIDETSNEKNALTISSAASRIGLHVIPTDEEQVIAEDCLALLETKQQSPAP